MSKFKVGDRVKLTGDSYESAGLPLESIHEVFKVDGSGLFIKGVTRGYETEEFFFFDDEVEAVEPAPTQKFFVKYVGPTSYSTFNTEAEAIEFAKVRASENPGDVFAVAVATKAYQVNSAPQEITFA